MNSIKIRAYENIRNIEYMQHVKVILDSNINATRPNLIKALA